MAGPDAKLDDSEWIDSDEDDPNPDSDLFADPARFCSMLKVAAVKPMHKQLRALLVDLMYYLTHEHKDSTEQRQAMVENGAVDIILDFLANKNLYSKERWNRRIRTLFILAMQSATLLPGRLRSFNDVPSKMVASLISRWRVKAEKMYALMWEHRQFVFCRPPVTDRDDPDFGGLEDENGIPAFILHFAVIRRDT
ncbi:hypothetical protein EIP86_007739 [Pleurotus ostreatoroseus]|nr:hypothetical protein EIP86_007739 [Pleurotus ostreatoroseus]